MSISTAGEPVDHLVPIEDAPPRIRTPTPPAATMLLTGIFVILLTGALRAGAGLLLPIAIAILLTFLLVPMVRLLRRLRLSAALAAALAVFGTVAIAGTGVALLATPAVNWVSNAPKSITKIQVKVRRFLRPLQKTVDEVARTTQPTVPGGARPVQIQTPSALQRLGASTARIAATIVTVVFLTYFLLATLPTFRGKLAELIESRAGIKNAESALTEIETQMSRFMLINMLTSFGVGLATWALLAWVGVPGALVLGAVAFLLNFIPYAGALVTLVLIGAAAIVTFDTVGPILLAMGGSVLIQMLEGNLVSPLLQGKHLPLNPVAIFLSLLYWGWVWGAVGALLAVPIMVMVQVVAARVPRLHSLAVLLDS